MDDPFRRPALTPRVFCRPWAVLDFLERAFGFERRIVSPDNIAGPASIGGRSTQAATHFARAKAAGA